MLREFDQLLGKPVECRESSTRGRLVAIPADVEGAVQIKTASPQAKIVSGATDMGVVYNKGRSDPDTILCLRNIIGHDQIEARNGEVQIGMRATWSAIERWAKDGMA